MRGERARRAGACWTAAVLVLLPLSGCQRSGGVESAATDRGSYRDAPTRPIPAETPHALPNGVVIRTTPAAADLDRYLATDAPAGRAFDLPSVTFAKGMEVREDPNGAVAALVAVLRQHPTAAVRIEVTEASPERQEPSPSAEHRADEVARVFEQNGLSATRISTAGRKAGVSDRPRVRLVVTHK